MPEAESPVSFALLAALWHACKFLVAACLRSGLQHHLGQAVTAAFGQFLRLLLRALFWQRARLGCLWRGAEPPTTAARLAVLGSRLEAAPTAPTAPTAPAALAAPALHHQLIRTKTWLRRNVAAFFCLPVSARSN